MTWKDDLVVAYRDHGLRVHEGAGWREFGVGSWTYGRPVACLKHQFVWPPDHSDADAVSMLTKGYNTGSYFLNPPVVNTFLGKSDDGDVYMVAGEVAQHGGQGVRSVLDRALRDEPPVGDGQNAPGPDDWGGASFAYWGTETHHYDGEPFHQYDALVRMSVAECQVFGWSANRILEHSNSTLRKTSDMRSVDGNQLRRDIAGLLGGGSYLSPGGDDSMSAQDVQELKVYIAGLLQSRAQGSHSVFDEIQYSQQVGSNERAAASADLTDKLRNRGEGSQSVFDEIRWAGRHPTSARFAVVVDDSTGTYYQVGMGTFKHLVSWDYVTVGRAAGVLDDTDYHTDAAGIALLREVAVGGVDDIITKPKTYMVAAGDSWGKICAATGVSSAALQAVNPQVTDINQIGAGQVLNIPK